MEIENIVQLHEFEKIVHFKHPNMFFPVCGHFEGNDDWRLGNSDDNEVDCQQCLLIKSLMNCVDK